MSGSKSGSTKRRHAIRHRGVVLLKPNPKRRIGHRARWEDPDTGKTAYMTLAGLTTDEARREWASRKSAALAKRRMDLDAGAPRKTGATLAAAIGRFYEDHPHLRERTVEVYQA